MSRSQNGYPIPPARTPHEWVLPNCERSFPLVNGPEGFALAHTLLFWHERIEPLDVGKRDDWGGVPIPRNVRDGIDLSNHDSYTAADANALRHPRGKRGTFSLDELLRMHRRLYWLTYHAGIVTKTRMPAGWDSNAFPSAIRWGEDFHRSPCDGMHLEWNSNSTHAVVLAHFLQTTPRGKRLLRANPKAVLR